MKHHRSLPIALIVSGVALFASLALQPGSKAQTASASASAPSPSASAAAEKSGPVRFYDEPFTDEKTKLPTPAEWKPTTPVRLNTPLPFDCNAYRLREWVKIRCSSLQTAELALLGGEREGVALFVDPPPRPDAFPVSPGGEIVFPVRRGDRRVFEWSTFGDSYEGVGFPVLAFLISESWAPDEPAPVIIVQTPAWLG